MRAYEFTRYEREKNINSFECHEASEFQSCFHWFDAFDAPQSIALKNRNENSTLVQDVDISI